MTGEAPGAPPPQDGPHPLLKAAAAADEGVRAGAVVRAIREMIAGGADAGQMAVARDYVKREKILDLGSFNRVAAEAQGDDGSPGDPAGKSAATALVELAQEFYTFGASDTGEPYAVPVSGPKVVAMLRGGKTSLRALLAREFYTRTGKAASQQALADALLVIEGMAQETAGSRLYIRTAQYEGALWLDLGDPTGRAVRIAATGWTVEESAPVLFKRTALTGPLPEPARGGQISNLWYWLNVAEADRPLVLAALVATLFSDQSHVVLGIFGERGTGKTTAVKVLVLLLDPSPVPVRKPPRDADTWVTAAAGSWVVALDNLSDIPPWLSDSLCRASTGEGDVRRKLYTDGDYAVFAFRRCVIFDSIDVGALAPDLGDRTVAITLDTIPDDRRLDEEQFWPLWANAHPYLLGAVLDLAVRVLARLPGIHLPRKPRMADFARILFAVDAELGTDALSHYAQQAANLAAEGLSGDPLAARIMQVFSSETFTGTSAELLSRVTPAYEDWRPPKGWPASARAATGVLRRLAPAFRKTGWAVADLGRGGTGHEIRWEILPLVILRYPARMPATPVTPVTPAKLRHLRATQATAGVGTGLLRTAAGEKYRPAATTSARCLPRPTTPPPPKEKKDHETRDMPVLPRSDGGARPAGQQADPARPEENPVPAPAHRRLPHRNRAKPRARLDGHQELKICRGWPRADSLSISEHPL